MKRLSVLLCCLLSSVVFADEPQLRIETHLEPGDSVVVGATLQLQVDVLVDTWFTSAPQLSDLKLPGAVVVPPDGAAQHLSQTFEGTDFFGLRYTYLITPNLPQTFEIPALSIRVTPGQGSVEQTARSEPMSFAARQPPGFSPGEPVLVAQGLDLNQKLIRSANPLKAGDSVTRELTLVADGAFGLSLPAPDLGEIAGLRRYLNEPHISTLDDGRGNLKGGQRVDSVTYRIEEPGIYLLPAVLMKWWDSSSNQARTVEVPEITVEASSSTAYKPVFSIADDLKQLGQQARFHVSQQWLGWTCLLIAIGISGFFVRPWWLRGYRLWQHRRSARRTAWLASADYAWQQIPAQLEQDPAQLSALYLWARRSQNSPNLLDLADSPQAPRALRLQRLLRACYGRQPEPHALQQLREELPKLHEQSTQRAHHICERHGLRPLNPGRNKEFS